MTRPRILTKQNPSPQGETLAISLWETRKTLFFGGRVTAPPLQSFCKGMSYRQYFSMAMAAPSRSWGSVTTSAMALMKSGALPMATPRPGLLYQE